MPHGRQLARSLVAVLVLLVQVVLLLARRLLLPLPLVLCLVEMVPHLPWRRRQRLQSGDRLVRLSPGDSSSTFSTTCAVCNCP